MMRLPHICFLIGEDEGVRIVTEVIDKKDIKKIDLPENVEGYYFFDTFGNSPEHKNISETYYRRGRIMTQREYDSTKPNSYTIHNTRGFSTQNHSLIFPRNSRHIYLYIDEDKIFE